MLRSVSFASRCRIWESRHCLPLCGAPVTDCRILQKEGIFMSKTLAAVKPRPRFGIRALCRIAVMTALYLPLARLAIEIGTVKLSLGSLPVTVLALLTGPVEAALAAALGELFEMGVDQIEYAAEVALEHHLGLTCDPICGLVQIPCIERNAVAAMRAINAVRIANFLTATRKISFDTVVKTMYETGRDLSGRYRETAEGGLAKHYRHS